MRVDKNQNRVEVKKITNLVSVKKDMLRCMLDEKAVIGIERGLSDHNVILL